MSLLLNELRRFAVTRSLFPPTTLARALNRLGFVQADPIRAPARAQDLTLRHRVKAYRAGDLERRYPTLAIEEDVLVNYGFLTRTVQQLMLPRAGAPAWSVISQRKRVEAVLSFVRRRGTVHPREVDRHFAAGTVTNYWGGSSSATTQMLELMHYRGLLRVVRRDAGVRVYGVQDCPSPTLTMADRLQRLDALVDVVVHNYAPLPGPSLSNLVGRLGYAVPQWRRELKPALDRARRRLAHARVEGMDWYWPADEPMRPPAPGDNVYLLAPFDPVVWDRRRFEILWGWAYRFEAYTPESRRTRGYYALPLLWRDRVIGWANVAMKAGVLQADFGFVAGRPPATRTFTRALDAEMARFRVFLGADPGA